MGGGGFGGQGEAGGSRLVIVFCDSNGNVTLIDLLLLFCILLLGL